MYKRINSLLVAALLASIALISPTLQAAQKSGQWKSSEVIKPEQLVRMLSNKSAQKPLVLQIGFGFLYQGGHIDGSIWAGPASRPDGIQRLKNTVKNVSKNKEIVIYCGCCPWPECPNVRPALATLRGLGFKNVKALYIPIDFEHDWIAKGLPITKGKNPGSH